MPAFFIRSSFVLFAAGLLGACTSATPLPPSTTYTPQTAPDPAKNARLAEDLRACQAQSQGQDTNQLSSQQRMVSLRGCLIQRGYVLLN
jgi:hypothetical protein